MGILLSIQYLRHMFCRMPQRRIHTDNFRPRHYRVPRCYSYHNIFYTLHHTHQHDIQTDNFIPRDHTVPRCYSYHTVLCTPHHTCYCCILEGDKIIIMQTPCLKYPKPANDYVRWNHNNSSLTFHISYFNISIAFHLNARVHCHVKNLILKFVIIMLTWTQWKKTKHNSLKLLYEEFMQIWPLFQYGR